jgi:hypothetical protein
MFCEIAIASASEAKAELSSESMSENNVSPFCLFDGPQQTKKHASIPRVSGPEVSQRVWTIALRKGMEAHT